MRRYLSQRGTPRIEEIYAVVVIDENGREGVVRRDTPFGTIPWTTDDPDMAETILELARADYPKAGDKMYLVRFVRVWR